MRKSTTKRTYTCVWCDGRTSNSNKVCNRCHYADFYAAQDAYLCMKAAYDEVEAQRKAQYAQLPPPPESDEDFEHWLEPNVAAEVAIDKALNYWAIRNRLFDAEMSLLEVARPIILALGEQYHPDVREAVRVLYAHLRNNVMRQKLIDLVVRFDPSK